VPSVLRALNTTENGLSSARAEERRRTDTRRSEVNPLFRAVLDQLRSPLTGILAAGGVLSVVLGSMADVAMIGLTILGNTAIGAWQERQAGQAVAALERIGASTARVLRDGRDVELPTGEIVPGDVLILAPGDRAAADARLIEVHNLEVDEAALTGESLPVAKTVSGGMDASHVILAGSDVTVGTGRAVVVAVGRRTRMGATAAALEIDETRQSPLGVRLNRMLRQVLPLAAVHEWTVSRPTVPARMRRIDLQTVWWRRRAQAPAPAQPTTVPCFRFSPKQDQRPPDTLLLCTAPWSHAPGSGLPPRSGAGKHTRGWLDRSTPPALPRSSMVGRPRTGAAARSFR